jgi:hypothetical protein
MKSSFGEVKVVGHFGTLGLGFGSVQNPMVGQSNDSFAGAQKSIRGTASTTRLF